MDRPSFWWRHTISPSRMADTGPSSSAMASQSGWKPFSWFPLREINSQRPPCTCAKARKPSSLSSYNQSRWSNGCRTCWRGIGRSVLPCFWRFTIAPYHGISPVNPLRHIPLLAFAACDGDDQTLWHGTPQDHRPGWNHVRKTSYKTKWLRTG